MLKIIGNAAAVSCSMLLAFSLHAQNAFQKRLVSVLPSNADNCATCHSIPYTGGSSSLTVSRVQYPRNSDGNKNSILLHYKGQIESVPLGAARGERLTISLMGDGYVEALDENDIKIALEQQRLRSNGKIHGYVVRAPALESADASPHLGKFGWKAQQSSLYSACADSMLNELGVTTSIYAVGYKAPVAEDLILERIVSFVRYLDPPQRNDLATTEDSKRGEEIFAHIGCALCHLPTIKTLPTGTMIDGGTYRVPKQVGGREFHPYSDFLLHDVGTGDGIVQAAMLKFVDANTANRFRTPPLWGLRYRSWLMHDGKSVTLHQAIMRHAGEASDVITKYEELAPKERHDLDQFLSSL